MPRRERFIPPPQGAKKEPNTINLPPEGVDHGGGTPWQLVVPTTEEVKVLPPVAPATGDSTTATPRGISEDHFAAVEWGSPEPVTPERMPTAEEIDRYGRRAAAILRHHRARTRRRPK